MTVHSKQQSEPATWELASPDPFVVREAAEIFPFVYFSLPLSLFLFSIEIILLKWKDKEPRKLAALKHLSFFLVRPMIGARETSPFSILELLLLLQRTWCHFPAPSYNVELHSHQLLLTSMDNYTFLVYTHIYIHLQKLRTCLLKNKNEAW